MGLFNENTHKPGQLPYGPTPVWQRVYPFENLIVRPVSPLEPLGRSLKDAHLVAAASLLGAASPAMAAQCTRYETLSI